MMKYKIKNEDIVNGIKTNYPKYTTQLMNLANQNAGATRPRSVGQLSELIQDYAKEVDSRNVESWRVWYLEKYPDNIDQAVNKILRQIENLKKAIMLIDHDMVKSWVEDLMFEKTYLGNLFQEAILIKLSDELKLPYRSSSPVEESQGIDGFVGDVPYSIKPLTYKTMTRLPETIDVKIIYYEKKKDGIQFEVE